MLEYNEKRMSRKDILQLQYGDVVRFYKNRYNYLIVQKVENNEVRGLIACLTGDYGIGLNSSIGCDSISIDELVNANAKIAVWKTKKANPK